MFCGGVLRFAALELFASLLAGAFLFIMCAGTCFCMFRGAVVQCELRL